VDWNQGIEYYNTLRRLKKPVIMLQYVGENHGLQKPANQKDYTVRMKEFFDHYLMGKPAPAWLHGSVSHLKLKDYLKERAKDLKLAEPVKKEEKKAEPARNSLAFPLWDEFSDRADGGKEAGFDHSAEINVRRPEVICAVPSRRDENAERPRQGNSERGGLGAGYAVVARKDEPAALGDGDARGLAQA